MINRPLIAYNTKNTFESLPGTLDLGFDIGGSGSPVPFWVTESGSIGNTFFNSLSYLDSGRGKQCMEISIGIENNWVLVTDTGWQGSYIINPSVLRVNELLYFGLWIKRSGIPPADPTMQVRVREYNKTSTTPIATSTSTATTITSTEWTKVGIFHTVRAGAYRYDLAILGSFSCYVDDGIFGKVLQFKSISEFNPENIDEVHITQQAGGAENIRSFFYKKRASGNFKYTEPSQASGIAGFDQVQQWYQDNIFKRQSFDFIFDRTDPSASKRLNLWGARGESPLKYSMPQGPERYEFPLEMVEIMPRFQ